MNHYINDWFTIIEEMNNDNTYKLAWGRALIECIMFDQFHINEKHQAVIEFDDISKCMLKYYWNQIFFFNLKQSPSKTREPVICQDTNKLINEYTRITCSILPVWYDEGLEIILSNNKAVYDQVLKHVSKTLHENVCWRFKKVPNGTKEIYIYDKSLGSRVFFDYEHVMALKEYGIVISKLLNYKWAQLLENFNFTPKIINKVNGISNSKLRRSSLTKYKIALLQQFHDGQIIDFYTDEIIDVHDVSIDHVIPWSYMYSDDIWNLVVTSKSNNSSKSNSIPSEATIEKLKERNILLLDDLEGKFRNDMELSIKNGYVDKFYYECRL